MGDVHPEITIVNGNFAVWFYNNSNAYGPASHKEKAGSFRTMISPSGKILTARETVAKLPDQKSALFSGLDTPTRLRTLELPGLPPLWDKTPSDYGGIVDYHGRWLFHFSGAEENGYPFYFADVDPERRKLNKVALIGTPGRIYNFAGASNVVKAGDFVYLAWIQERDLKTEKMDAPDGSSIDTVSSKTQLVVSRWRPGEDHVLHLAIRQTLGSNIHLAAAAIGDRLLVAWHEGLGSALPSKIGTHRVDLKNAAFQRELPLSTTESFQAANLREMAKRWRAQRDIH